MTQQTETNLERIDRELADVREEMQKYESRLSALKIREKTLRGNRRIAVPEAQIRQGKFAFLPGERVRVKAGYAAWYNRYAWRAIVDDGDIVHILYADDDACKAYRIEEDAVPSMVQTVIPAEFLEAVEKEYEQPG